MAVRRSRRGRGNGTGEGNGLGRLPDVVEAEVRRRLPAGEDLEVEAAGDLTADGRYGFAGLAASEFRLFVLGGDPEGELEVEEIPLSEVVSIRHKTYVGNGELEVITYDRGSRSVRHTRSLDEAFEKAAQKLGRLLRQRRLDDKAEGVEEEAGEPPEEEVKKLALPQASMQKADRCEKCGTVLVRGICPKCRAKAKTILRLFTYVGPHKVLAVAVLLLSVVIAVFQLLPTYLSMPLVDKVLVRGDKAMLVVLVMVLALTYVMGALLQGCRQYLSGWLGQEIIYDLRNTAYRHLQRLSLSFFDHRRTGELMSRVNRDTERVQGFLVQVT
ncbi:MAG: hypothetical protein KAX80_05720, partial [Planctomycetes bacterium]|nr:hypothetical protein [Planctomycetota bacterium]